MKVKVNHHCSMAIQFSENRRAGGKGITSLYKAWRTQKCEHGQLSLSLVSPHSVLFNLKNIRGKRAGITSNSDSLVGCFCQFRSYYSVR